MMLTGQVFSLMNATATKEQAQKIIRSAEGHLFDASCGGYRLNTDFGEIKTDMGRMFGFAYGEKENQRSFSRWWRGAGFFFRSNGFALRAGQR